MSTPTEPTSTSTINATIVPQMALPDVEYIELVKRLNRLEHKKSITLINKDGDHVKFYRTQQDKIKAIIEKDGTETKYEVEPLSAITGETGEDQYLRMVVQHEHPNYTEEQIEWEVDFLKEMKASAQRLVESMGITEQQAVRMLEENMARMEVQRRLGRVPPHDEEKQEDEEEKEQPPSEPTGPTGCAEEKIEMSVRPTGPCPPYGE